MNDQCSSTLDEDRDQLKKIKIELKSKRLLQRVIKQLEKGGIQYFDWPIPVFIRFIRKNIHLIKLMKTGIG